MSTLPIRSLLGTVLLVVALAPGARAMHAASPDSAAVMSTVVHFHVALAQGDSTAVAALLAPDARILEGGKIETRREYLAHHFHSDAAFLGAMTRETGERHVTVEGDMAWVVSTTRLHGTYRDRDLDLLSAELMVLRRTEDGWRIAAIHWSSGRR